MSPLDVQASLETARSANAQARFEDYDFQAEVAAFDGWEYYSPGKEWTRAVYLETEEEGPSQRVYFTVVFAADSSSEIKEVYAINENGVIFGEEAFPCGS
jgi:hypothetical protein